MYMIALYILNYYEDKYFISLFAHPKHTIRIYYHGTYTQVIIKKFNDKCFEMHFSRRQFKCAFMF